MTRSGVFRAERYQGAGVEIDLAGRRPLEAIAQALAFPDWYGGNWDALEDCLGDLSWRSEAETVLVLRGFTPGEELDTLIDILASTAQFWAAQGRRFAAVFVDPERRLPGLPALE